MTRDEALTLLKLDTAACDLTADIVTKAYRRAILANHPDTGTVQATMVELQQARQTVTQHLEGRNNPCRQCNGRGRVPFKMGTRVCSACKGTGETK